MAGSVTDVDLSFLPLNGTYQTQFAGLAVIHWHSRDKIQILPERLGYKIQ